MKKLIYFGFILGLLSCQTNTTIKYAILSGHIDSTSAKKVSFYSYDNVYTRDISLDDQGNFTDTIKAITPSFYSLYINKKRVRLYLEPGSNLSLQLTDDGPNTIPVFKGQGAQENDQILQLEALNKKLSKYESYKYIGSLSEQDFLNKMDSVKQARLDLLDKSNDVSEHFKFLEKENILYSRANQLNNFEAYKHYISKDKTYKVSDGFYDYKKTFTEENDDLISVPAYVTYFEDYISELTDQAYKKDSLIDYSQVSLQYIVDSIKNQHLKNIMLYNDAQYAITYVDNFEKYYNTFKSASTNAINNAKIDTIYQALKKVSKGQDSPQFADYINYKGGTASLKDYLGHYVYIDVWATWCGPCKAEIPFLKQIEKAYDHKNIKFISISVDQKSDYITWQKMIKDKHLGGIQLFADNNWNSEFVKNYIIKGIPRFIMIDPKGKIISSNAPRPSNPDLKKLFSEYKL